MLDVTAALSLVNIYQLLTRGWKCFDLLSQWVELCNISLITTSVWYMPNKWPLLLIKNSSQLSWKQFKIFSSILFQYILLALGKVLQVQVTETHLFLTSMWSLRFVIVKYIYLYFHYFNYWFQIFWKCRSWFNALSVLNLFFDIFQKENI